MIKFTGLLCRKPGMTQEEFIKYHRYSHAPLFASLKSVTIHVRRYMLSHPGPTKFPGLPASDFDGMSEIWFDDLAGIKAVFEDPEYFAVIRPDEQKFIDFERSGVVMFEEFPVIGAAT